MTLADVWRGWVLDRAGLVIAARAMLELETICRDHAAGIAPRPRDLKPENPDEQ